MHVLATHPNLAFMPVSARRPRAETRGALARLELPLAGRPGVLLVVHPDEATRQQLSQLLPRDWVVTFAADEEVARRVLQLDQHLLSAHRWAQADILAQHAGKRASLVPALMRYWFKYTDRFNVTSACIVGARLRSESGPDWLRHRPDAWDGAVVLLGAGADAHAADAVLASAHDEELVSVLEGARAAADRRASEMWAKTLTRDQLADLAPPRAQHALKHLLRGFGQDYVVLGDPFGALLMDRAGNVHWWAFGPHHLAPTLPEGATAVQTGAWRPLGDTGLGATPYNLFYDAGKSETCGYDAWLSQQVSRRDWT